MNPTTHPSLFPFPPSHRLGKHSPISPPFWENLSGKLCWRWMGVQYRVGLPSHSVHPDYVSYLLVFSKMFSTEHYIGGGQYVYK
ncbi:hypothetical protein HanIR_Chr16g0819371 [Helianthus annuus]|nr:hypothetical protein HanIR_Chr16g0819371 [Helianthus annuus]